MEPTSIIRIVCPDEPGLVAKVSTLLFEAGCNVIENDEFVDQASGRFFMRTAFSGDYEQTAMESGLHKLLPADAGVECFQQRKKRIVILATKEAHCLGDLLIRSNFGDLSADVLAVVSNHELLKDLSERLGHRFHFVGHEGLGRSEHEARILELVDGYRPDYIVMAKYMRILSPTFIERYPNRIINIHHSFLPAFIGANPYRQAHERGVKVIGATAHFASLDLDEGPIIAQGTIPVNHAQSVASMIRDGRDVEKSVLSKALRLVFEDRVFVHGNRTVVFG
jgi:formyltetrahydrofolate deformylase